MDAISVIRDFLDAGGAVLYPIMAVLFLMWAMILERVWYFGRDHKLELGRVQELWNARADKTSWYAHRIREQLISERDVKLNRRLPMIRTLVALCPLLGLLGTVSGMIEVFEIMAVTGSGNARAMASGVTKATIPTMAGMVAALSGMYLSIILPRRAADEVERIEDEL